MYSIGDVRPLSFDSLGRTGNIVSACSWECEYLSCRLNSYKQNEGRQAEAFYGFKSDWKEWGEKGVLKKESKLS